MTASPIRRRFVRVGARRVHYLRAGQGPALVLVHPAIADASLLAPQIERLAGEFTCLAFDSPGFGCSDPLPVERASIVDLAEALAETLRVLGFGASALGPVPLFGYHTGAAIALELATRHPDLVAGLILEGLPLFTRAEVAAMFRNDLGAPLQIDDLGGHFANTWTRFRDQATFFPWRAREPANVLAPERAVTPDRVQTWVSYFFRSARHYAGPYRDAQDYGEIALQRLQLLRVPLLFALTSTDLLVSHYERFKTPTAGQQKVLLGPEPEEKYRRFSSWLAALPQGAPAPIDVVAAALVAPGIQKWYVDLPAGQMLVRSCGAGDAPALLLFHDAPGSALLSEPLIQALGKYFRVHAPDLPGCGESSPLPQSCRTLAHYAAVVSNHGRQLAAGTAAVYGIGFGASLAVQLAQDAAASVNRVVVQGLPLPDTQERADMQSRYAPPIQIDAAGTHWYRTWLMLRDSLVYFPWYTGTRSSLRRVDADFGGARLHHWTCEVMKQHESYGHIIAASLDQDLSKDLPALRQPLMILRDPLHPFAVWQARADALCPAAVRADASLDAAAVAATIWNFYRCERAA